ncbi:WNT8 protein, partial [Polypterus senegalus]
MWALCASHFLDLLLVMNHDVLLDINSVFDIYVFSKTIIAENSPHAYLTYSSSVQVGAQLGVEECKYQFAWDRWNCPESALQLSTHNGLRSGGKGWIWGGCSDNAEFGQRVSKQYVDALETGQDSRAAMNLHNNEAGRMAVKATMRRSCKCHGVSGSCNIQTCWLQLSDFREIGNYLKVKHGQAQKLELDKRRMRAGNSADNRGAIADAFSTIGRTELIYLEDSPDYCVKNTSLGLHGTEGRECLQSGKNLSQWEKRSCKRLCHECGLKVEERKTEIVSSCNCKFHWCCTVKCEQCTQVVTKHFCSKRDRNGGPFHNVKRKNRGHRD